MTVNDNILIELQNHQTRLNDARLVASDGFKQYMENTEAQLGNYTLYENQAHSRRLVAISNSTPIDPNDELPFVLT